MIRKIANKILENPFLCFHPLGQEAKKQRNELSTVIETNIQATNAIYLNTLAQDVEMDSMDRQNLFVIAMLTPYVGGEGVYTARAMLGIDPEDYNLPYRIGNFGDTSQIDEANSIKIYPNPTKDRISIISEVEFNNAEFTLFDIVGREVLKQTLNGKELSISLKALKSGVYFYQIKSINFETIKGKIIKQ